MVKSANMDPAWIGVIGTLAGGILVGGVGFIAKYFEMSRAEGEELRKYRLLRLEKLHELLSTQMVAFHERLTLTSDAVIFSKSIPDKVELLNKTNAALLEPLPPIVSLQRIYAPELANVRERFLTDTSSLIKACALCLGAEDQNRKPMEDAFGEVISSGAEFIRGIEDKILNEITPRERGLKRQRKPKEFKLDTVK